MAFAFSVVVNCEAKSKITSIDITQQPFISIIKMINQSPKAINKCIIAEELSKFDFTLVADFILITQVSKK